MDVQEIQKKIQTSKTTGSITVNLDRGKPVKFTNVLYERLPSGNSHTFIGQTDKVESYIVLSEPGNHKSGSSEAKYTKDFTTPYSIWDFKDSGGNLHRALVGEISVQFSDNMQKASGKGSFSSADGQTVHFSFEVSNT